MDYNPEDKVESGGTAQPGKYRFKVDEAVETTFRSGNKGLKAKLLVAAFSDKDITVYCNFVYLPQSLWKLEQFMSSIGLDFSDKSLTAHDFVGLQGDAEFVAGEKYLEAGDFIAASANNGAKSAPRPAARKANGAAPTDEIPF